MSQTLIIIMLAGAGIPALLFFWNIWLYRRLPDRMGTASISVLIPARNEERNLRGAIESALANSGINLEVLVLDDESEDRTGEIAAEIAARDSRVRLIPGKPRPPGWCGKPHACHLLGQAASHDLLLFIDADVRLEPDALARMAAFMQQSGVDLASGVPRQITGTFSEKLLIPLIHFILLGFLPIWRMRRSRSEAYGAGCGQIFLARRDSYLKAGGHRLVAGNFHDGLHLPRGFRRMGLRTDLFDATDLAECRMYENNQDVWPGLAKTAVEGFAAPRVLPAFTLLLLAGQVLPFAVLAASPFVSMPLSVWTAAIVSAGFGLAIRVASMVRYKQSKLGAFLHPLGILAFLAINWGAALRAILGKPIEWKGRVRTPSSLVEPKPGLVRERKSGMAFLPMLALIVPLIAGEPEAVDRAMAAVRLEDQFGQEHRIDFPAEKPIILTVADHKGYEQVGPWIAILEKGEFRAFRVEGVADVTAVPKLLRGMFRRRFSREIDRPLLLDWEGELISRLKPAPGLANIYLVDQNGRVRWHTSGPAEPARVKELLEQIRSSARGREDHKISRPAKPRAD